MGFHISSLIHQHLIFFRHNVTFASFALPLSLHSGIMGWLPVARLLYGRLDNPHQLQDVRGGVVQQMKGWEGEDNCGAVSGECPELPCGQKCLYLYTGTDGNVVTGTHTTPV